ncbi:MAG TPA: FecR domain-containing protein [Bacteroidales bacterium]|nr:FecR domain-containing protein [Bacteroidales bacterium]
MTEKEKNSIPVDLITRYLSGEVNTDDLIDLERWKAASEENRRTFEQYRRIWESTGELTIFTDIDIDIDHEWDTFLIPSGEDIRPEKKSFSFRLMPLVFRVAAVIIIGLLLGYSGVFIYRALSFEKISAVSGKMTVDLPDGSTVTLNKGAVLEFPRKFETGLRQVKLNGEAFFNVHRDITRPFSVRSGSFRLQVLGTSFNMVAWKKNDFIEVVVKTGEVEIYPAKKAKKHQILSAGQIAIYSRDKKIILKEQNQDPNFDTWASGHLEFKDAPMEEVAATIENLYHIKVIFRNDAIRKCRFTVSIDNISLPYVLKTIEDTLNIKVTRQEKVVYLSGEGC